MAKYVHEVMNPELFQVAPTEPAARALDAILALGITSAPVVDSSNALVGVVSLRDLIARHGPTVGDRMTKPVITMSAHTSVEDAARTLSETDLHRLVVVDDDGAPIGIVAAVNLMRALIGLPARHPSAFPHVDPTVRLSWTDETVLDELHADIAPDGPGVLVLVHGGAHHRETPVWVEALLNVRTRVLELILVPQAHPTLSRLLEHDRDNMRFLAAVVRDAEARERAAAELRASLVRRLGLALPHQLLGRISAA